MGAVLSLVPAPLDAVAERWWALSTSLLRALIVAGVGIATGQGEMERICGRPLTKPRMGGADADAGAAMAKRLLRALRLSGPPMLTCAGPNKDSSASIQALILRPRPFDPQAALEAVASTHRIGADRALVRANLARCLAAINHVNRVSAAALALKATPYDANNPAHEAMLEALWAALKPGVSRQGGRVTSEWGEIGFQGKDPATDFRGMGILGLQQLLHFATTRPTQARAVLLESHHPRRFFPFAATGINVSGFVLALLTEERLLDEMLVEQQASAAASQASAATATATAGAAAGAAGEAEAEALVQKGLELVHGVYADIYETFHARWLAADPPNVMSFPPIFDALKRDTRRRLRAARGDFALLAFLP